MAPTRDFLTFPSLNTHDSSQVKRRCHHLSHLILPISSTLRKESDDMLQVNFKCIFASFGATAHTKVGALLLHTILQVFPLFAAAMAHDLI